MLLWKDTFSNSDSSNVARDGSETDCAWQQWPRPPAGFLDFGSVKLIRLYPKNYMLIRGMPT